MQRRDHCRAGAQLAVDVTLRSAVTSGGEARPRAADLDGAVADEARKDKEAAYPELLEARRCSLVVVALETGGRWGEEAADFIDVTNDACKEYHSGKCDMLCNSKPCR